MTETTLAAPSLGGAGYGQTKANLFRSTDPDAFPVITGREEEWRFTPLDRLAGLTTGQVGELGTSTVSVSGGLARAEEVAPDDPRLGQVVNPSDRISALAFARRRRPVIVTIPRGSSSDDIVAVTVKAAGGTDFGHIFIDAEPDSKAVVVLQHTGHGVHAQNVEIRVQERAELTVVSMQQWDPGTVHAGAHAMSLGADARLTHLVVTLGGDLVRLTTEVRFAGPGANAELYGIYFADAGQHLEHRNLVIHDERNCTSLVVYKGALQGEKAHTVWIGDVLIPQHATGTDTYENNRNLVLTDGARADSVPNLEIGTAKIERAGHASATGRFDDEQVFYLQSRGIPEDQARRMVVRAFFGEILQKIHVPEIVGQVSGLIDEELAVTGR